MDRHRTIVRRKEAEPVNTSCFTFTERYNLLFNISLFGENNTFIRLSSRNRNQLTTGILFLYSGVGW